ncbi:PTS system galactose-specific transporter subunit IIB [Streptococcus pneumoniae]|nr:PTS sugar transporter subunit IIA [Streptococcus pneumoniae]COP32507.1 PTS system galactose-specific transporter subunit IIB [Streptococcus pneumoniae]
MIKILAACGAGVNSSHQIKSALEEELSNRGYDVHCDAVMVKDVNEDLMKGYDIFTPIAATDLGFEPGIPVIEAGKVVVVRLEKPVTFHNMIAPDKEVEVSLLFFIINNSSSSQTNILAQLMDFFTGNGHLEDLSKISEPEKLYAYIAEAIA